MTYSKQIGMKFGMKIKRKASVLEADKNAEKAPKVDLDK